MLSVIMSGLNVAQKDLQVASNNVANANTVGFKRSSATFQDVFSNDPSANPKTAVGSGAITSMISRNTSQGAMTTTDKVTDLAIAGRGYFTLASTDPETGARNVVYTRAGNFTVNVEGEVVDSSDNQLQVFPVDENGKVNTSAAVVGAVIQSEKNAGTMRIVLDSAAKPATDVKITLPSGDTKVVTLTQANVDNGYITVTDDSVTATNASTVDVVYKNPVVELTWPGVTLKEGDQIEYQPPGGGSSVKITLNAANLASGSIKVQMPDGTTPAQVQSNIDAITASIKLYTTSNPTGYTPPSATVGAALIVNALATEYKGTYLQGIGIDSKGMIQATYGDGTKVNVGAVALASFRNDAALKPIGNTKFIASDSSGGAILTRAGAPFAGDILSGTLEQANVDITQELMTMLKAQQLYNGNARMLQTAVEVGNRVTDKI
jgi:flagellar hook protein FlgE